MSVCAAGIFPVARSPGVSSMAAMQSLIRDRLGAVHRPCMRSPSFGSEIGKPGPVHAIQRMDGKFDAAAKLAHPAIMLGRRAGARTQRQAAIVSASLRLRSPARNCCGARIMRSCAILRAAALSSGTWVPGAEASLSRWADRLSTVHGCDARRRRLPEPAVFNR